MPKRSAVAPPATTTCRPRANRARTCKPARHASPVIAPVRGRRRPSITRRSRVIARCAITARRRPARMPRTSRAPIPARAAIASRRGARQRTSITRRLSALAPAATTARLPPARTPRTSPAAIAAGDVRGVLAGGNRAVVAAGASADNLRVIDVRCRAPRRDAMAALAGIGARDVRGILAGRLRAVMAHRAITRDRRVIEGRRRPRTGAMTGLAWRAGLQVRARFARGLHVVVAGGATAERFGMIEMHARAEARGGVARAATLRAQDMARSLRLRVDARAFRVAGGAFARRALEDRAHMATLAGRIAMFAEQFEARGQVIEALLIGGRLCTPQERHEEEHERETQFRFHGSPHWMRAPLKLSVVWQRWHWAPNCPR